MKQIILKSVVLATALSLCACNDDNDGTEREFPNPKDYGILAV